MPASFLDDDGNRVKKCNKCANILPVSEFYGEITSAAKDRLSPRCKPCTLAGFSEANRRRAKKRKQRTHKLSQLHVDWIREQQHRLSIRETARAFSKRFFAMKINPSTVQRIFAGKIHAPPEQEGFCSIYDVLEDMKSYSGSVEDYLDETDTGKIKF